MRKILFIAPDLEYGGAAGQLTQLARGLHAQGVPVHLFIPGKVGPWGEELARAGVGLTVASRGRILDLRSVVRLRELVRQYRPDVLHAWTTPALRWARVAGRSATVVATPYLGARPPHGLLQRLDAWLLRRSPRVLTLGEVDAQRCRRLGVSPECLSVAQPGIARLPARPANPGRFIAVLGPLEPRKGLHEAIWALDILRHLHADVRLVLAGEGTDRPRLEQYALAVTGPGVVQFPGAYAEPGEILAGAAALWVLGRSENGVRAALEGMSAGVPVVAYAWPRLAELIAEGQTGFLVPPGDKVALARATQHLLEAPALTRQLGETGQKQAAARFSLEGLVQHCRHIYG